ncbi:1,4-dihydroxy-6-naphtoate synthase [Chlamydia avium]|nr:MqnA/MqnD/SBP family protein [Chlamydia avium]EPP37470.1 menaquinone biosynthesis family protein [Chlamydia psittaci 10_743_SC13]EPP38378.1 menaquinone biosynthesis family protein [Chlamydia avium]VVT42676.1 1,4-dihydroxy-6-naphtoate synthase [Chlamydia avium]
MILSAAFSSCPNDIFLFRSFLEHHADVPLLHQITITDISRLNTLALQKRFSLIKISAALLPHAFEHYNLMEVGNIISYGVGPLLLSSSSTKPVTIIATPGVTTTAHLLCKIFYPKATLFPMKYHTIIPAIVSGDIEAGVVIHEERFHYPSQLYLRDDLGTLWENATNLPLPLGCLVVEKNLPQSTVDILTSALYSSLSLSLRETKQSINTALKYSKDHNSEVIQKFIDTYVNQETLKLSELGKHAIQKLSEYASSF